MKPFAESCEQNKHPILSVLDQEFSNSKNILEIGSGTGQHAVFFSAKLPHLNWQPSEQEENIPGILSWLKDCPNNNINQPVILDVYDAWPIQNFDGVFSANTVHIMAWAGVVKMIEGIGKYLASNGLFCLYGPFNYDNQYTSESNKNFDQWLKERDPDSGIRDFEKLEEIANKNKLIFKKQYDMPANNKILVWIKE